MTRSRTRTRSATMEAVYLHWKPFWNQSSVSLKTSLLPSTGVSIQWIHSKLGPDQTFTPATDEDVGDSCRRQSERSQREKEKGVPPETRMPFIKMDFPRFNDGDDPVEWVYKAEQYFDYFSVPQEKKVKMVSFHLDREALQWYQWEECSSPFSTWEDFIKTFCREFGSHGFEDFAESLFKLQQTGSLKDYIAEFRRLATRIHDLSPTFRLSCFIGGLQEVLKHDVKLLRPTTVHKAMNFAHEVDAKLQKLRYAHSSGIPRTRSPLSPTHNEFAPAKTEIATRKDMHIKKLTPEEIQYKKQNGLCFYCDEKFMRGHKCARKQILLLDMGYSSVEEEEIVQELQQLEQCSRGGRLGPLEESYTG